MLNLDHLCNVFLTQDTSTIFVAGAGARVFGGLARAWGQGLVVRGMAPTAASYGTQAAMYQTWSASQAHVTVAGLNAQLGVAGQTAAIAGLEGQYTAGQSASLTDFILDVAPVTGAWRAWGRMRSSCSS
jgi:hypothetical protein